MIHTLPKATALSHFALLRCFSSYLFTQHCYPSADQSASDQVLVQQRTEVVSTGNIFIFVKSDGIDRATKALEFQ